MPESALVVDVPNAEPYVSDLRNRYDPSAVLGVPAHITILFPLIPPNLISTQDIERLTDVFFSTCCFDFVLNSVGRFVETAFLSADPEQPFIDLTQAIEAVFPLYPPYGGIHGCIKPHLTVANNNENNADIAEKVLHGSFKSHGAIHCACTRFLLLENSTGRWAKKQIFNLDNG